MTGASVPALSAVGPAARSAPVGPGAGPGMAVVLARPVMRMGAGRQKQALNTHSAVSMKFSPPKSTIPHPDLDLERDQDLERERWDPSLERAGERTGERLADFPEPRGLALLEAERDA